VSDTLTLKEIIEILRNGDRTQGPGVHPLLEDYRTLVLSDKLALRMADSIEDNGYPEWEN